MSSILIVDDKASSREFLRTLLEHNGYRLLEAGDGAEALQLARAWRPDLIITDILMPTMDGYELVRQLRATPELAETGVIFCSAHYQEREAQALARECGVSSVITKPCPTSVVLAAVEKALERSGGKSGATADEPVAHPSEQFDREHLRLLTDKLSQKADDLQASNQRLAALIELGTQFASELDTRRLIQSFVHGVREIVGARAAIAGILDSSGARFQSTVTSGMTPEAVAKMEAPEPDSPLVGAILRHGQTVRSAAGTAGPFQSWLGAPIASPRQIYGFVGLIDKLGGGPFTAEDERLARILSAQVGRIYQNGSLYAEAMSHAAKLEREAAARLEAEVALAEREERIRLLLDSTAEAIYGLDLNGMCTFANAACVRILGYSTPEQFIGRDMHAQIHYARADGSPYPLAECKILRALRNEPTHCDSDVLWRADGSSFPAEIWAYPIVSGGAFVGAVVTFLDITQRRRLEEQYREAQQRLRHAVISSPVVLLTRAVVDNHIGPITWISDNVPDVLGYSVADALQEEWWASNTHPEDVERIAAERGKTLLAGNGYTREYRFRHADGSYRWLRSDFRLLRDAEGKPAEAVGAWVDVSERKRVEEEQRKLREQLLQAQKLESIGRLAGGVAHDFNNLLTVINGYSELLVKDLPAGGELNEMASEIGLAGQRAADLTRQLLLLSRKQVSEIREVNLNHVVAEIRKMLTRVIGEDIRLEVDLEEDLGLTVGDPSQFHQVLMNLAVNARDAMPNGGNLLIQTRNVYFEQAVNERHVDVKPGSYVELQVSDSGVGMDAETQAHLFEPFFTTKAAGRGTGLGLATVYGIVKQAGGAIWVYSEPGKGTTFKIYLPQVEASQPGPEQFQATEDLHGSETILIVEDQEQLLKIAASILSGYGYRVLTANSPSAALAISREFQGDIDLLLTDVVMPEFNGLELAEQLKGQRPGLRTLYMSGYSERLVADPSAVEGQYLDKPFTPDRLAAKVKEVLASATRSATIVVADDEPSVRKLVRGILAGAGYQVIEAANGKEVLSLIESKVIDLLVTDLAMPELDGIETIAVLRQSRPKLKIIAMSGRFVGPLLQAAEHLGAHVSLAKPVQAEELLAAVRRLIHA